MENTDQTIKKCETYVVRVIDTNTTVLLVGVSNDDNPEVVSLKVQLAASQTETKTLMTTTTPATTAGDTHNGKRARVQKNDKTDEERH